MKGLDVFELHANLCRTLSNPTRLKILALLGKQEMSVGEMAETIGVPLPNLSQHLAALRSHDLVLTRRQGQTVYYSLGDVRIIEACAMIRAVLLDQMRMRGEVAQEIDPRYVVANSPSNESDKEKLT
jgi:ArsR family transcriptional regulator, virulence genes transcriptional regulator